MILLSNFSRFVGNSWSIDNEKAIWFARDYLMSGKNSYPLSTEITTEQVASYFIGRQEEEIFVCFEKLDFSNITIEKLDKNTVDL